MTLFMPELKRKKRVRKLSPDTRRVFSHYDRNEPIPSSLYDATHTGKRHPSPVVARPRSAGRHHKPHPTKVNFLIQDCRLLHEPICEVEENKSQRHPEVRCMSHKEQNASHWWLPEVLSGTQKVPKYSQSTTSRGDYTNVTSKSAGAQRHTSNPNVHASRGIVPVTHLRSERGPRLMVEHISYQHQYDSRKHPTQPNRGKLHGSFVWDVLHPVSQGTNSNIQTTSHLQESPGVTAGVQEKSYPSASQTLTPTGV